MQSVDDGFTLTCSCTLKMVKLHVKHAALRPCNLSKYWHAVACVSVNRTFLSKFYLATDAQKVSLKEY